MHPVFLHIGPFELASYGVMTALGYAVASYYLLRHLPKNIDKDTFWNLIFIIFMGALVGAKLLFILVTWPQLNGTMWEKMTYFAQNFRYGFVFYGGLIVAVAALIIYMKKKNLPLLPTSDFIITGLPLGHAFGRVGCFLAGCCHGKPTALPWGVIFSDPHAMVSPDLIGVPVHPVQLYEAVGNLLIFFLLHKLYNRPHKNGMILVAYIACYGTLRFVLEFFRGDFRGTYIFGLSPAQLITLLLALTAGIIWWRTTKKGTKKWLIKKR
ncbi:prolipoprotein diacylglyceryl transferase [Candidatus Avelusimicrobium caledoniensis]|uniref:prolipoprotein diacylglyceryl transferase n=1 Tax=Candidatus Avelusimicrobium caledoniensis TaxID=3416220 RepID=UPI003D0FCC78